MAPPQPPKIPLTLESLAARVRELEDDRRERDLNARKTRDVTEHEYAAMLDGAIAQLEPRFESFEKVNNTQLALLRAAESERLRRAAREELLREQKEREEVARSVKEAERKHRLAVYAVIVPIVLAVLGLAGAAITSQIQNAHPSVAPAHP